MLLKMQGKQLRFDHQIVGYILLTKIKIINAESEKATALTSAPAGF